MCAYLCQKKKIMPRFLIVFTALIISLIGCRTTKPTDWATECASRFPPRTDTLRFTERITKVDTVFATPVNVPFIIKTKCPPSDTIKIVETRGFVDCPPTKTVRFFTTIHDSIVINTPNVFVENSLKSELNALNTLNMSLISEIEAQSRQINRLRWLSLISLLIIVVFTYIAFKTFKNKYA